MPDFNFELSEKPPIFDNVHGFIHLTDLEWDVVDSRPFQRLRNIKQLGLTNLVFPGANHTRFSHSIGVLHIASEIFDSLQYRHRRDRDFVEIDKEVVRLAALLHDIGHYPLSHIVEGVIKEHTNNLSIPSPGEIQVDIDEINPDVERIQNSESHKLNCRIHGGGDYANHERIATLVIFNTEISKILRRNRISKTKIEKICRIITGKYPGPENSFIHSELDADRFDYLLRDSYNTGVGYGKFDLKQIIRHLDFKSYNFPDPNGEEQNASGLVIRKKGQRAVEDYLISRYYLYNTVIYQKANIGFHKMMEIIYKGLIERNIANNYGKLVEMLDNPNTINLYLNFDDFYLDNILRRIQQNEIRLEAGEEFKIKMPFLKDLITRIINREPLKLVKSTSTLRQQNTANEPWALLNNANRDEISSRSRINKNWIISSEIITGVTKVNPKLFLMQSQAMQELILEKIKVFDPDKLGSNALSLLTDDESSIIRELVDKELVIRNLYTKNEEYKNKLLPYC